MPLPSLFAFFYWSMTPIIYAWNTTIVPNPNSKIILLRLHLWNTSTFSTTFNNQMLDMLPVQSNCSCLFTFSCPSTHSRHHGHTNLPLIPSFYDLNCYTDTGVSSHMIPNLGILFNLRTYQDTGRVFVGNGSVIPIYHTCCASPSYSYDLPVIFLQFFPSKRNLIYMCNFASDNNY